MKKKTNIKVLPQYLIRNKINTLSVTGNDETKKRKLLTSLKYHLDDKLEHIMLSNEDSSEPDKIAKAFDGLDNSPYRLKYYMVVYRVTESIRKLAEASGTLLLVIDPPSDDLLMTEAGVDMSQGIIENNDSRINLYGDNEFILKENTPSKDTIKRKECARELTLLGLILLAALAFIASISATTIVSNVLIEISVESILQTAPDFNIIPSLVGFTTQIILFYWLMAIALIILSQPFEAGSKNVTGIPASSYRSDFRSTSLLDGQLGFGNILKRILKALLNTLIIAFILTMVPMFLSIFAGSSQLLSDEGVIFLLTFIAVLPSFKRMH